jgi:sodium/potassium-transporting ATPase subunit alpha
MSINDEKVTVVEDAKITFAKVYKPERTRTIQTTDSRRPSISAPKKPDKKDTKKNVDIVRNLLS